MPRYFTSEDEIRKELVSAEALAMAVVVVLSVEVVVMRGGLAGAHSEDLVECFSCIYHNGIFITPINKGS
jgi:hypothetical protein